MRALGPPVRALTLALEHLGYESFAASVGQEAWDATAWGSPLPPASDVPVPSGYMPKPLSVLARAAAPVCYQLRRDRLPRLPLRFAGMVPPTAPAGVVVRDAPALTAREKQRTRPRDARRVDAH